METIRSDVIAEHGEFGHSSFIITENSPGWSTYPIEPLSASQTQDYLSHLGIPEALEPTKANLDALISVHLERVTFENLDNLLDRPASVEAEAVLNKLLRLGRGGCCYELNTIFGRLLLALGYHLQLRTARFRLNVPDNCPTKMTWPGHIVLFVRCADDNHDRFIVDVGVGAVGIYRALSENGEGEPFRVRRLGDPELPGTLEISIPSKRQGGSGWKVLYTVDPCLRHWVDFAPLYWFSATYPKSQMRYKLIVARMLKDGSWLRLVNDRLSSWSRDGRGEDLNTLCDEHEILDVLQRDFGLRPSHDEEMQQWLIVFRDLLGTRAD
ncbi:arylamine N-acetyltransferase-like [Haemaphysalis longicornis]